MVETMFVLLVIVIISDLVYSDFQDAIFLPYAPLNYKIYEKLVPTYMFKSPRYAIRVETYSHLEKTMHPKSIFVPNTSPFFSPRNKSFNGPSSRGTHHPASDEQQRSYSSAPESEAWLHRG